VIWFGPHNALRTGCMVVFTAVFVVGAWLDTFERHSRGRQRAVILELSRNGFHWRPQYRRFSVLWQEIAQLRMRSDGGGVFVDFRPLWPDFALQRPDLDWLAARIPYGEASSLDDGWYRLPHPLSATAQREFEENIRSVLPAAVTLSLSMA
jgi:hypothetical protein